MTLYDYPLEELKVYLPTRQEPADFDDFWQSTLAEARSFPLNMQFQPVDYGLKTVRCFDVSFAGYGGQTIKGWFLLPAESTEKLPCVVEYIGYNGGRGFPFDWLFWPSLGYAHFVMDTRGQGSGWRKGDTPDPDGSDPQIPGFLTRGVLNPQTYYYRRVLSDAVRAVEAARANPAVDPQRVAVSGGSQGGGISLAVAGLIPELPVTMPDVPFLCHYRRATEISDTSVYAEISNYCRIHRDKIDTVFDTLSYFDGVNFAVRAHARALFSVALMDDICPPSTVFAAYNHYAGEKEIRIWPYNRHEGGESFQQLEKMKFLAKIWG